MSETVSPRGRGQFTKVHDVISQKMVWHIGPEVSQVSVGVCAHLSRINLDQVRRNKPKLYKIAEHIFFNL